MITTKLKEYEIEKNKRRRNKNSIGQKKLRHLNYRLYIDYHRIYINERRGEVPLPPIIPIYLVEHVYALPRYCVYWGIC